MLKSLSVIVILCSLIQTISSQKCAQNGEYCLTSNECCSKSCLSFSYKCVAVQSAVDLSSHTNVNTIDLESRFGDDGAGTGTVQNRNCAKKGEYCLTHTDCCSRSCLSFSYKCVDIAQPPQSRPVAVPQQYPQTNVNTRPTTASPAIFRPLTIPPAVKTTTESDLSSRFDDNQGHHRVGNTQSKTCAKNGEYCVTNTDCCSGDCLNFSYKCVQTQPPQLNFNAPGSSTIDLESRFGEDKNCAQNGEYCQSSADCCSKSCLSFSYKCVPTSNPPQLVSSGNNQNNNHQLVSRFGNNACNSIGERCRTHSQCCSHMCLSSQCRSANYFGGNQDRYLYPSITSGPRGQINLYATDNRRRF
uniref:Putative phenoloxidase inhibitor protein n=1 Tax=Corethrella appendiculata TaxID=1370023 RepID=U5EN92_9DIPT